MGQDDCLRHAIGTTGFYVFSVDKLQSVFDFALVIKVAVLLQRRECPEFLAAFAAQNAIITILTQRGLGQLWGKLNGSGSLPGSRPACMLGSFGCLAGIVKNESRAPSLAHAFKFQRS